MKKIIIFFVVNTLFLIGNFIFFAWVHRDFASESNSFLKKIDGTVYYLHQDESSGGVSVGNFGDSTFSYMKDRDGEHLMIEQIESDERVVYMSGKGSMLPKYKISKKGKFSIQTTFEKVEQIPK